MRSDLDMQTDPEESNSRVAQKRMLEQIVAIPATLYLPSSVVAELNEICQTLGYTPEQLVIEALRDPIDYWNEFYEYVMTLPVEPQDLGWPEDPVSSCRAIKFRMSISLMLVGPSSEKIFHRSL